MISDIRGAEFRFNFRFDILRPAALLALSATGVAGSPFAFGEAQTDDKQTAAVQQQAPARQEAGAQQEIPAKPEEAPAQQDELQQIVITGTNIIRNGYTAPTPLTVVGQDQFQTSATGNIADYVNTIPVFQGSQTPTNQYHQSSKRTRGAEHPSTCAILAHRERWC